MMKKILFVTAILFVLVSMNIVLSTNYDYYYDQANLTDDAHVRRDAPDTNYGSQSFSYYGGDGNPSFVFRNYFKFNISGIQSGLDVYNATFCVYNKAGQCCNYPITQSYWVNNDSWGEADLTWNTQPCNTDYGNGTNEQCSLSSDTSYGCNVEGEKCFDVTDLIIDELNLGDSENISFLLMGTNQTEYNSTTQNRGGFYMKEDNDPPFTILIINGTYEIPTTTTTTEPTTTTTTTEPTTTTTTEPTTTTTTTEPTTTTTTEPTTTTTFILPTGNYTAYLCLGSLLARNNTDFIGNETVNFTTSQLTYTSCEYGCGETLFGTRCLYSPAITGGMLIGVFCLIVGVIYVIYRLMKRLGL
jgi:hypothetical protein